MKRFGSTAFATLLLFASAARADVILPPPPPPKPPTKPALDTVPVVAGIAGAAGLTLAGLWLARTRRRAEAEG
jgi:hypothetical protein